MQELAVQKQFTPQGFCFPPSQEVLSAIIHRPWEDGGEPLILNICTYCACFWRPTALVQRKMR
jgi:hypothetical protein